MSKENNVAISPEAQSILASEKDLLETAAALEAEVSQQRVREQVLLRELEQLRQEISSKQSQRMAVLTAAKALVEYSMEPTREQMPSSYNGVRTVSRTMVVNNYYGPVSFGDVYNRAS